MDPLDELMSLPDVLRDDTTKAGIGEYEAAGVFKSAADVEYRLRLEVWCQEGANDVLEPLVLEDTGPPLQLTEIPDVLPWFRQGRTTMICQYDRIVDAHIPTLANVTHRVRQPVVSRRRSHYRSSSPPYYISRFGHFQVGLRDSAASRS